MSPQVSLPATVTNELFLRTTLGASLCASRLSLSQAAPQARWNWVEGPKAMSWDVQAFRWQNKAGFAGSVPLSLQASHLTCSDSGPPPNQLRAPSQQRIWPGSPLPPSHLREAGLVTSFIPRGLRRRRVGGGAARELDVLIHFEAS